MLNGTLNLLNLHNFVVLVVVIVVVVVTGFSVAVQLIYRTF